MRDTTVQDRPAYPLVHSTARISGTHRLLHVDLPATSAPSPSVVTPTSVVRDFPLDESIPTENLHDNNVPFGGPLPWPLPPAPADPLEVSKWVATVLTNTSPQRPLELAVVGTYMTAPLAREFASVAALLAGIEPSVASRGVVVDAWIQQTTRTAVRLETVVVIERTYGDSETAAARDELVAFAFVLVARDDGSWAVASIERSIQ